MVVLWCVLVCVSSICLRVSSVVVLLLSAAMTAGMYVSSVLLFLSVTLFVWCAMRNRLRMLIIILGIVKSWFVWVLILMILGMVVVCVIRAIRGIRRPRRWHNYRNDSADRKILAGFAGGSPGWHWVPSQRLHRFLFLS